MFERFTDRARRAIVLAQNEARDMGHNFIGPEHLLLGLFQVGGVAETALSQVGAELEAARQCVAEAFSPGHGADKARKLPFNPRAKKTLELSLREALRLGHNYIGTEHVLLGILRVADNDPGVVGGALGVDMEVLRSRVFDLLNGRLSPSKPRSPALDEVLDRARGLAGSTRMTSGHLVSAVLADPRSQGAMALASLGVTEDGFAEALAQVPLDGSSDGRPTSIEIKIGDKTTTIEDPDLIEALSDMPPDRLRTTLNLLKQAIKKGGGPEAAA
jgi:ATP-dependent Clp protease ATP-binding subunit ClpA